MAGERCAHGRVWAGLLGIEHALIERLEYDEDDELLIARPCRPVPARPVPTCSARAAAPRSCISADSADCIAAVAAQRCPTAVCCADAFDVVAWATDRLTSSAGRRGTPPEPRSANAGMAGDRHRQGPQARPVRIVKEPGGAPRSAITTSRGERPHRWSVAAAW